MLLYMPCPECFGTLWGPCDCFSDFSNLCILLPTWVVFPVGPLYNNEGVLLHVGATIIWSDGRRANFQCGFDQALTQYLEVCKPAALTYSGTEQHIHNDRSASVLLSSQPYILLLCTSLSGRSAALQHLIHACMYVAPVLCNCKLHC